MIKSNAIKILCYVIMIFSVLVSILFLITIIDLATKIEIFDPTLLILFALFFPLLTSVSLYPIFALANIDESLSKLNEKLDKIIYLNNHESKMSGRHEKSISSKPCTEPISSFFSAENTQNKKINEAVQYINNKYGTDISLEDEYQTIKEKIQKINNTSFACDILKKKVSIAKNKEEIINTFLFIVEYSKGNLKQL